jgi:hypothetical protein
MSVVFRRGQELSRANGLNILLKSKDGSPKNAAEITYSVYDFTTGVEVLIPALSGQVPLNAGVGEYFASFVVPVDANVGEYRIRWTMREYLNSPSAQVVQKFAIVADQTQTVSLPGATLHELDLVRSFRIFLRDNNPARNYRFAPPAGEEAVNGQTRVFGFVWEDHELLEFLRFSLDSINMHPPMTFFDTIDELMTRQKSWRTLLLVGAAVHAFRGITANWILEEFGYSIGGVSLDLEKSSKYQSLMNDTQAQFKDFIDPAKETVKVIRGLKQSRYGVGIRSSFGPSVGRGALTPRRFLGLG